VGLIIDKIPAQLLPSSWLIPRRRQNLSVSLDPDQTLAISGFAIHNAHIYPVTLSNECQQADLLVPVREQGRPGPGLAHFGAEDRRGYIREPVKTQRLYFTATTIR
jgi:hypothetical protein